MNCNSLWSCRRALHWGKKGRREFFCLFSKKGFTEAMIKVAKKEGVVGYHYPPTIPWNVVIHRSLLYMEGKL
jgi:hypothetical protein